MKTCPNCGAQAEDTVTFCPQCGTSLGYSNPQPDQQYQQQTQYQQTTYQQQPYQQTVNVNVNAGYAPTVAPRNIVLAVVLTIVTCGLYGIYWMISINNEVNTLAGEPAATSGGMVFLLSLITCDIYGLYWMYKMGERCDRIKGQNGSSNILYLVLAIFGLGIVSYCLMQDTVNKAVTPVV